MRSPAAIGVAVVPDEVGLFDDADLELDGHEEEDQAGDAEHVGANRVTPRAMNTMAV